VKRQPQTSIKSNGFQGRINKKIWATRHNKTNLKQETEMKAKVYLDVYGEKEDGDENYCSDTIE
jgi:uncharacterized protein (UPF0335 family)